MVPSHRPHHVEDGEALLLAHGREIELCAAGRFVNALPREFARKEPSG
jgi:hypothetical protein